MGYNENCCCKQAVLNTFSKRKFFQIFILYYISILDLVTYITYYSKEYLNSKLKISIYLNVQQAQKIPWVDIDENTKKVNFFKTRYIS